MSWLSAGTAESLEKREAGLAPNFDLEHTCDLCGQRCLCPDRYLTPRCESMAYHETQGRPFSWRCTPCMMNEPETSENRTVYYKAHGV